MGRRYARNILTLVCFGMFIYAGALIAVSQLVNIIVERSSAAAGKNALSSQSGGLRTVRLFIKGDPEKQSSVNNILKKQGVAASFVSGNAVPETQGLTDENGELVIIFDSRCSDVKMLEAMIRELKKQGYCFKSAPEG